MKKILSVVKREYFQFVRTKGFLIGTILGPVLMAALLIVPVLLGVAVKGEKKTIAVVDQTSVLFTDLDTRLAEYKMKDGTRRYNLTRVEASDNFDAIRTGLSGQVRAKKISAYIRIPSDIITGGTPEYFAENVTDFDAPKTIGDALNSVVLKKRMNAEGIDPTKIDRLTKRFGLKTIKVSEKGEEEDTGGSFMISYALVMILLMTMSIYGAYILRGVIEEKNNRIVEIVLSSMKPFELMMGKILGIAAVGLTQYAVWILFGLGLSQYGSGIVSSIAPQAAGFKIPSIPPYVFGYFALFFILGYFLFATIYAGVGSMVNNEKESQQYLMPITMSLVIPMLLMPMVIKAPNSTLSVILSLVPFFAPILMMLRITVVLPPLPQILLSIFLLVGTTLFMTWLAAKIYRVGCLMYGKPPSFPEIVKWIRYK